MTRILIFSGRHDLPSDARAFSVLAAYKTGTGTREREHRDAFVGTWDLGTREEGLEDTKYGTRERQKQGCRGRGI